MYRYTVRCEFTAGDPDVIHRWLAWLNDPHIADVIKGGASGAEIVKMAAENPTYEIRYRFPDRAEFDRYRVEFAPALQAEGLAMFPPEQLGMVYHRSDGEVVLEV